MDNILTDLYKALLYKDYTLKDVFIGFKNRTTNTHYRFPKRTDYKYFKRITYVYDWFFVWAAVSKVSYGIVISLSLMDIVMICFGNWYFMIFLGMKAFYLYDLYRYVWLNKLDENIAPNLLQDWDGQLI